ncbi:hypothetical protein NE619_13195 [Anaerovorax odorimutans]|uniref:Sigma-70 family RNA polymerase sigma factor n=1 Tax=Anaerovorax odorimutans TaxID=109327 RepID=A0ABT1RR61_9FIRM|nr:hypothetical protein [Anaerovorax odorimutans]MCQ4637683.1 hypothetical protein [Anaerovorax odorimutans]
MTREEVNQIYYIDREIEMWKRQLLDIRAGGKIKAQIITGMPHANTNMTTDPTGEEVQRIEEIEVIIQSKLCQIQAQKKKVYAYIATLDDSLMRQIIMHRCITLCSWQEVAMYVGGGNTADSVRKRFERHFEEEKNTA